MNSVVATGPTGLALPPEVAYPPAPWHANAQLWLGLFRSDVPVTLPAGVAPLLGRRGRVVALVRYLEGSTLCYDELLIGIPARVGLHPGVYVEYLYVNSAASLWGGRRIWGLPKEPATFTWHDETCRVTTPDGALLVALQLTSSGPMPPPLPAAVVGIGRTDESWAVLTAPLRARFSRASLRIMGWSPRYPFRLAARPRVAVAAAAARVTFPSPALIAAASRL